MLETENVRGARSSIFRKGLEELEKASGGTRVGTKIRTLLDDFTRGGVVDFNDAYVRLQDLRDDAIGEQRSAIDRVIQTLDDVQKVEQAQITRRAEERVQRAPVSYTHLTLPTMIIRGRGRGWGGG